MTDDEMRAFSRELREAVAESRQQGERLDRLAEGRRLLAAGPAAQMAGAPGFWDLARVVEILAAIGLVFLSWEAVADRVVVARFYDEAPEAPLGAVVYVPRCAPAFGGRALTCVDEPRVRTVEVLP